MSSGTSEGRPGSQRAVERGGGADGELRGESERAAEQDHELAGNVQAEARARDARRRAWAREGGVSVHGDGDDDGDGDGDGDGQSGRWRRPRRAHRAPVGVRGQLGARSDMEERPELAKDERRLVKLLRPMERPYSKTASCMSPAMPMPVSETSIRTSHASSLRETWLAVSRTSPAAVNLMAFQSRLRRTCS